MLTPDVLSVGGLVELPACELRHAAGFGRCGCPPRPGGDIREPDAALNGDAGRGAGMSSTSMSEYDPGRPAFAAAYVGGGASSVELALYALSGEPPTTEVR